MAEKIKTFSAKKEKEKEKYKKEHEKEYDFVCRKIESNELSQINEGEFSKEYDQSNLYDSEFVRRSSNNSINIESSCLNETQPFAGRINLNPILKKASEGSVNSNSENDMKFIMKNSNTNRDSNSINHFSNRFNEQLYSNNNDNDIRNPFSSNAIAYINTNENDRDKVKEKDKEINDNLRSNDMINLKSHFSNKNVNSKSESNANKNNSNINSNSSNSYLNKNKIHISGKQVNKNQNEKTNSNTYGYNNNYKDDKFK